MPMAQTALLSNGRQVVLRGAAPCCLQGQATRRRMAVIGKQPAGPGPNGPGAVCAIGIGRP